MPLREGKKQDERKLNKTRKRRIFQSPLATDNIIVEVTNYEAAEEGKCYWQSYFAAVRH